jgi:hypothetical protein
MPRFRNGSVGHMCDPRHRRDFIDEIPLRTRSAALEHGESWPPGCRRIQEIEKCSAALCDFIPPLARSKPLSSRHLTGSSGERQVPKNRLKLAGVRKRTDVGTDDGQV